MKKTVIASIILVLVITLTSCGSTKGTANKSSNSNPEASTGTKDSIESINNVMQSVEATVDSLEDAADINLDGLQ